MIAIKKKRVYNPRKKVKATVPMTIAEEIKLIEAELPDVMLPEPIPGSPFIRRGFVECISDKGMGDQLVIGKTYRINELHMDGDKLKIDCEDGDPHWVPCALFKAIDYGPFKAGDVIICHGFQGSEPEAKPEWEGLLNLNGNVVEGNDTHAHVKWNGFTIRIPNENLRLQQRKTQLGKNPFKKGDRVRCTKSNSYVTMGWLYNIAAVEGDYVYLNEDGDRFYHNMFTLCKVKRKKKKIVKTPSLEDYVKMFLNKYSYEILTPSKLIKYLKDENVPKELLNEDVIINILKNVNKSVFHW